MSDGKTTCSDCRLFAPDPCVCALGACMVSWVSAPGRPYDGYECVSADSQSCGFFEKGSKDTAGDTWERIESDAARHTCDFISEKDCDAMTCEQCEVRIRLDLIRRCRSLAEKKG